PVSGTGAALSFGNQTATGTYSVVATNAAGCVANMNGNPVISITPNVGMPSFISGAIELCVGESSIYVAVADDADNITYSIVSGGATINSSTGEVSNVTADFVVRATATGANGCGTETVDIAVTVGQINVATVQTHLTGSGYSLADGDFLWTGKLGSDWDDINNWLKYSQAQNEFVAVTAPPL